MSSTTIKVTKDLRDRLNLRAEAKGLTLAGFVERLLESYERRQRMEAFGKAFRSADTEYWDEFRAWDVTLADGLDDE